MPFYEMVIPAFRCMPTRLFNQPWFPAAAGWALFAVTLLMMNVFGESALTYACGSLAMFGVFVSMWWCFIELLQGHLTLPVLGAVALSWGVLGIMYIVAHVGGDEEWFCLFGAIDACCK